MPATHERLVSADSHVTLTHDSVKARLASKFHSDYDAAVEQLGGGGIATNALMNQMPASYDGVRHAIGRPGNADPVERLKDMDEDGVDVEVLYCEFSAFRYLYSNQERLARGHRAAFNDTLIEFGQRRSRTAPRHLLPDPHPRHRHRRRARSTGSRNAAASRCSCPSTPSSSARPDYYDRTATTRSGPPSRTPGSPPASTSGSLPSSYYPREPRADDPVFSSGTIQPMSAMFTSMQCGQLHPERHLRALPEAQDRLGRSWASAGCPGGCSTSTR